MKNRFQKSLGAAAVIGSLVMTSVSQAKPYEAQMSLEPHVEATLIVKFVNGANTEQRGSVRAIAGAVNSEQISPLDSNTVIIKLPSEEVLQKVMEALNRNPNVEFAEPDYIVQSNDVSNDTYLLDNSLWGMQNGPGGSNAVGAWVTNTGSRSVAVGIIDEGIQLTHPELAANMWINSLEIPKNKKDDDRNGYVDDVNGWDFANNDNTIYDGGLINPTVDKHGTHVAGTIGAVGGNGAGVAGVNWNVTMISAKFLGRSGGTLSNAVRALDYLTALKTRSQSPVSIIATNNSWGGGAYSQALLDAINRGGDAGIFFVAAAGNSTNNNDATASYPSNYVCATPTRSTDCVIAVAAIDVNGGLASFSSYGNTTVDIGAPGVGIKSTMAPNTYDVYSGTSMATPHVTGAIALFASKCPVATMTWMRTALLDSGTATTSLAGKSVTGKRLNVGGLLTGNCN
jgi:subtilisin family serine protease